jgi:hypothetical protein
MNNELGRIWKEAIVAYCKVLSWHLLGGYKKKPYKSSVGIVGLWAEI